MERVLEILLSNAGTATVLALLAAVAGRGLRRPVILHALWVLVLLRLFGPPLLEVPLLPARAAGVMIPAAVTTSVAAASVSSEDGGSAPAGVAPRSLAVWLWLAGTCVVVALAMVRTFRMKRLIAPGAPASWALATRVDSLARAMGLRHPPPVTVVGDTVPPMLWGSLGAPRLVLPTSLLHRLSDPELDALIAHELAHLKRRDHWVRHLELAAMVTFWWLPVVWWARRRLRAAEEVCCDGLVVQALPGQARAYADCLVKTMDYLSRNRTPDPAAACGLGALHEMKGRIRMIMTDSVRSSVSVPTRLVLVLAAVVGLGVFPSLTERSARAAAAPGSESAASPGGKITLTLQEADLKEVLRTFADVSGLTFVVHPDAVPLGALDPAVSLEVVDTPWDQVLEEILSSRGLSRTLEGKVLWIHPVGTILAGDRDFTGDPISLTLRDADLADVLDTFADLTQLTILAEPGIEGTATVDVDDLPWDQVLDMILRVNGLEWSRDESTIKVLRSTDATGEQLVPRPLEPPQASTSDPEVVGSLDGSAVYRFRIGGRVTEPRRISGPNPVYPEETELATGKVVVETLIDASGSVRDVVVLHSPSAEFTRSAVDALRTWRFDPATLGGRPVAVRYALSVRFDLE